MIAAIAFVVSTASFPGGSSADLVDNVGVATGRNVFVTQAFVQPIKKFSYETKSYEDLGFDIRMNAKLHLTPATDLIFQDDLLPPFRMPTSVIGKGAPSPQWKSFKTEDVAEGKVTFNTKGAERLNPLQLEQAHFSKPVSVHWMFERFEVAAHADKMGEVAFLTSVAKSVGGKFVDDKDGYRLDLDAEPFRKRILNMLALRKETDPPNPDTAARHDLMVDLFIAIYQGVDKKTLLAAFQTPDSKAEMNIDGQSAIVNKIAEVLRENKTLKQLPGNRVGFESPAGITYVDPRGGLTIEIGAKFTAKLNIPTIDAQRKPGKTTLELMF